VWSLEKSDSPEFLRRALVVFVINFTWLVGEGKALRLLVQSHRDQIGQRMLSFVIFFNW